MQQILSDMDFHVLLKSFAQNTKIGVAEKEKRRRVEMVGNPTSKNAKSKQSLQM